jgi:hypothetical protein
MEQTAFRARTSRQHTARKAIPFPELPDANTGPPDLFWRSAWLRGMAKQDALRRFTRRKTFVRESEAFQYAIYGAIGDLEYNGREDLKNLISSGGLLYAWIPEGGAA